MKLYLVRHGESEGNIKEGFISGRSDNAALTVKGKTQIVRTSWDLKDKEIETIFASPVQRAQETAKIIGTSLSKEIKTLDWLTELDHGIFEGHYWWEVIHKIPPAWRTEREDYRTPYPEGESMEMLICRVWKGLSEFISSIDQKKDVVLVSHQAVITAIRYCLEKGDPTKIQTAKQIEEVLHYMHNVKLPNGGYVVATIQEGKCNQMDEVPTFEHVEENDLNLAFYLKSILNIEELPQMEHLETASEHTVYKVTTDKTHIVKILDESDGEALKRQIDLYYYLNEKSFPVPYIEYFDDSNCYFKKDILIQDFVEGDVSKFCSTKHPEKAIPLLNEVYTVIEKVHQLPMHEVKKFWVPPTQKPFVYWKPFMHYNINMTLHALQSDMFPPQLSRHLIDTFGDLKKYILHGNYPLVPIHSDLSSGNIISHHEDGVCRLSRIVDFEWARLGDRLWDFAYYWGWLERESMNASRQWATILEKKCPDDFVRLNQYRLLFHAWTVRDADEYKKSSLRLRRAKKSREILESEVFD